MIYPILPNISKPNILSFKSNKAQKEKEQPFIFIGMPMKQKKWDDLNQKIKTVAEKNNAKAQRVDDILKENLQSQSSHFISKNIFDGIDKADVVIADISERNPNVYFELGYAMGKGKKVLPIALKGTDLPFDVKDIYTIFYTDRKTDAVNKLNTLLPSVLKTKKPEQV